MNLLHRSVEISAHFQFRQHKANFIVYRYISLWKQSVHVARPRLRSVKDKVQSILKFFETPLLLRISRNLEETKRNNRSTAGYTDFIPA